MPRHLQHAIRCDEELNKMLANVTLAHGGVVPHIHDALMPRKKKKKHEHVASHRPEIDPLSEDDDDKPLHAEHDQLHHTRGN
eukprot:CAMPEP_0113849190 /NCGR_PEP_ID=MMETSP0372-20130328/2962_1 /TAXON_ID=340204 /ORGANISM="Lankesteria abbotti" /LENGTH=81 /DNA_ID=CAMNT_0000818891 /DNA_START=293 /DNA_END=538 /DNA_ORIENTATION=- /assembly_acc=CAM_ASM_000359